MIIPKENRWLVSITKKLVQKRLDEAAEEYDLARLEVVFIRTQAQVLGKAAEEGLISGKNAETRRLETDQIKANSELLTQTRDEVETQRLLLRSTTAQRRYYEDLLRVGLAIIGRANV